MRRLKMRRAAAVAAAVLLAAQGNGAAVQASESTAAQASESTAAQASESTAAQALEGAAAQTAGSAVYSGQIGSWGSGGTDASTLAGDDYAYDSALMITAGGISEEYSNTERITAGSYDGSSAAGIVIDDAESGHNGVLVWNADYTISDASITMLTDADGSDTCDFSGKGTAVAAFGSDANVTVENSDIHTSGVATMPIFADDGATLTVKNSTLTSEGGTLYKAYLNTPDQGLMVAPPWILGIMGTSRCSNMMGNDTTTNVLDSETSADAWAVLSTDAGEDMYLNIYNTSLTLTNADESEYLLQEEGGQISETLDNPYTTNYGAGYGTYAIGNAVETFAGADISVGTYATIFTGGSATYTSLAAGKVYELKNSAGETTETYTAAEDKVTTINSDTFGFMAHQGTNSIVIEKGTIVNSGFATFLVKTGSSNEQLTASVDDAEIVNGGVLIQVMDNDDATNGGMMDADDEANTNGGSQNFKPVHTEDAGFDTGSANASSAVQRFTFTNGNYAGNIYNASGSDGLDGNALYVTLGEGAALDGAAAQTAAVHVTYDGSVWLRENGGFAFDDADEAAAFAESFQNTEFSINEYFDIGQVANLVNDNSANAIYITLMNDAVWNVTGTSLIAGLSIADDAQVVVPGGVTLTVGGVDYTDCTLTAEDEIAAGVEEPEAVSTDGNGTGGEGFGGAPGGMGAPGVGFDGAPGGDGQQMPEKPDGGMMGQGGPGGNGPGGDGQQPPEKPDGEGFGGGGLGSAPGGNAPGGMQESDMANANAAVNTTGIIAVADGEASVADDDEALTAAISENDGVVTIENVEISGGNYSDTAISSTNSETVVKDSAIMLSVDEAVEGTEIAGSGLYTDSGETTIENSVIEVNGAGRYTVAAENDATLIVRDSVIIAGGDEGADGNTSAVEEPFSNAGLLISGTSRANFSVGQSHTYYYNSLVAAEGWAALSTDSATGSGLEFVGYGTEALALHGGYGIYADTNCRDYLYGSTIVSAEVGAIISNNGSITIGGAEDAAAAVTADGNAVLQELTDTEASDSTAEEDGDSVIIAGRNAVQLHSPDMMGEGNQDYSASLTISNTSLITDDLINGEGYTYTSKTDGNDYVIAASEDYAEKYGEAVGAYVDYVTGAVILAKSTSAEISLDNVTIDSASGVAVLSALNSDSMSRYLKSDVGNGVNIAITDSTINGSFVHDDYQRDMHIAADGTTINGAVTFSGADEWNAMWEAYSDDENCCWYGLDPSVYVTDTHETTLSLSNGSIWNVTGESRLTTLTVSSDSVVSGVIEAEAEETLPDGSTVYTNAVVTAE